MSDYVELKEEEIKPLADLMLKQFKNTLDVFIIEYSIPIRAGRGSQIVSIWNSYDEVFVDEPEMLLRLSELKKTDIVNLNVSRAKASLKILDRSTYSI